MGGKGSGRVSEREKLGKTEHILSSAASGSAQYLSDVITGKRKRPSWAKMRCAFFIIEQVLGKAAQKHEITGLGGDPLTIQALAILLSDEGTERYLSGKTSELPTTPKLTEFIEAEKVTPK